MHNSHLPSQRSRLPDVDLPTFEGKVAERLGFLERFTLKLATFQIPEVQPNLRFSWADWKTSRSIQPELRCSTAGVGKLFSTRAGVTNFKF